MTSLTIVRRIKAPPGAVFNAFIDPAKIALWWGPDSGPVLLAEVDPTVGGRFHVRFRMEDGSEHASSGIFETLDRPTQLSMSWSWDNEPGVVSHISVQFRAIDIGTELTFTHARLADEETSAGHEKGWNGAFDKLEARSGDLA